MANIASQRKRIHRSERERLENRRLQSAVKTHFRRLERAVESGDSAAIADEHRQLLSRIDNAVRKGALIDVQWRMSTLSRRAARGRLKRYQPMSRATFVGLPSPPHE